MQMRFFGFSRFLSFFSNFEHYECKVFDNASPNKTSILLTSYKTFLLNEDIIVSRKWHYVILDEVLTKENKNMIFSEKIQILFFK